MEFSTKINIPISPFSITHQDKLILLGSCFTENIGNNLSNYQFKTAINPFGITYNPISLFNNLNSIIENKVYTENDLLLHNELYISLDHHGVFSGINKDEVKERINHQIENAHAIFKEAKYIIITLGTSFVYNHLEQNKIVANCHKIPNAAFKKRLLTIKEITDTFDNISHQLKDKTILFTVSPVRHWRDGAIENQRSKSILIESIHQIVSQNKNCHYFPAYEIMMDELRDYRFYAEDMLHPNEQAIKYIWQRFGETYFNIETITINKSIEKIKLMLNHRTKHDNTLEERNFEILKQQTIKEFKINFPDIAINLEI